MKALQPSPPAEPRSHGGRGRGGNFRRLEDEDTFDDAAETPAGHFGQMIDFRDLRLHECVGSGKTAEVFRGTYRGDVVAVKSIFAKMQVQEQISFSREVSTLSKITHPNLVKMFGCSLEERPFRIVTEFCEGGTVFDLVYNAFDVNLIFKQQHKMCLDIALAMEYLHGHNPQIIHRDLKSLNLLLVRAVTSSSDDPYVKVADFGLAKMKDPGAGMWGKMTEGIGTLHWMAPEVLKGSSYDEKIDIYSYAMVLFEIVGREVPFDDEDPSNIPRLVCTGVRPELDALPPDSPESFISLITACWDQNPRNRPDFRQIVLMLRRIDSNLPMQDGRSRPGLAQRKVASGFTSKGLARGPAELVSM